MVSHFSHSCLRFQKLFSSGPIQKLKQNNAFFFLLLMHNLYFERCHTVSFVGFRGSNSGFLNPVSCRYFRFHPTSSPTRAFSSQSGFVKSMHHHQQTTIFKLFKFINLVPRISLLHFLSSKEGKKRDPRNEAVILYQAPPSSNSISQGKKYFYKLPYLGCFSTVAQSKIRCLVNLYCNDLDI